MKSELGRILGEVVAGKLDNIGELSGFIKEIKSEEVRNTICANIQEVDKILIFDDKQRHLIEIINSIYEEKINILSEEKRFEQAMVLMRELLKIRRTPANLLRYATLIKLIKKESNEVHDNEETHPKMLIKAILGEILSMGGEMEMQNQELIPIIITLMGDEIDDLNYAFKELGKQ